MDVQATLKGIMDGQHELLIAIQGVQRGLDNMATKADPWMLKDHTEDGFDVVNSRLDRVEDRFDQMDGRLEQEESLLSDRYER